RRLGLRGLWRSRLLRCGAPAHRRGVLGTGASARRRNQRLRRIFLEVLGNEQPADIDLGLFRSDGYLYRAVADVLRNIQVELVTVRQFVNIQRLAVRIGDLDTVGKVDAHVADLTVGPKLDRPHRVACVALDLVRVDLE